MDKEKKEYPNRIRTSGLNSIFRTHLRHLSIARLTESRHRLIRAICVCSQEGTVVSSFVDKD
ncbi:hypothetical protein OUZ56_014232 [Daphnia magna]|uniref:Uncharacterized protein n=1 Tax=Daphnia magna TaxID=35525 RepID=A0ABQ9Z871_9CRUS|nr:hypothetical protein OUZ56_014232 [Daphnia magna]